jgi:antitoxin (DNA-binding transcriptional repressor) of toxin-antitoxin stability system
MRYRIAMSIAVEARDDRQAYEYAVKLSELLKSPLVRMAVQGEEIQLSDDGRPIVHQPQRELP